jgi:CYTH domain-containing protein
LPEIERRWLVEPDSVLSLLIAPARKIEDRYLDSGRLRLRAVSSPGAPTVFKLGKKYERAESGLEQVVTIYLSESEYTGLVALPGASARKLRYAVAGGSLDVYEFPDHGPAIFEFGFQSEAAATAYEPPSFVGEEVTHKAQFSGHALAHKAP